SRGRSEPQAPGKAAAAGLEVRPPLSTPMSAPPGSPDDAADDALPPYRGLSLAEVRMVRSSQDAEAALSALLEADVLGFDTESKPTFRKGEVSTGPHLVQLATDRHAYLFQIGTLGPDAAAASKPIAVLRTVLESSAILK